MENKYFGFGPKTQPVPVTNTNGQLDCILRALKSAHYELNHVTTTIVNGETRNSFTIDATNPNNALSKWDIIMRIMFEQEKTIEVKNVNVAIEYLIEFKYAKEEMVQEKAHYLITFPGLVFIENGGYEGHYESEQKDIALERRNARYLRLGTVWAAIFAGAYLIWDVAKYSADKNQILGWLFLLLISSQVYQWVKKLP